MKTSSKVIRNSLWMGVQPVVLNLISIFVVGYIANKLGQDGYGRFVLAFSFVALFMPICTLGLRSVAVRDMASDRKNAPVFFGKYFTLRIILSCVAYATLVIVVNSLRYPTETKIIIYIAGLNLFFKTTATTLFDRFQAREKMKYIAYSNLISGALLTLFSVIVIYVGYRLLGITIVYVAGSLILVLAIGVYYRLHFKTIKLTIDTSFWRDSFKKGIPFFLAAMLWMLNMRICIVLLSKMTDDASVGLYGAAFNIVSKLYIFPDSIGTAIFPTIALLYAQKNMEELGGLCEKFFRYVLLIGIPFSVGITLLSPQIINLIYGEGYEASGLVLSVLSCGIPFLFMIGLFGFALGAVHLQTKALAANVIATVCNVIVTVLLIPRLNEIGAAVGFSVSQLVTAALMFFYFRRFLPFKLDVKAIIVILAANAVMGGLVVLIRGFNLVLAILAPGALYLGLVLLFRAVNKDDLGLIKDALIKRKKRPVPPGETSN